MARARPAAWPKAKDAVEKLSIGAKSGGQPARRFACRAPRIVAGALQIVVDRADAPILIIDTRASPDSLESWVFVQLSWTDAPLKALPASWADAAPHAAGIRVRHSRLRRG